MMNDFSYWQRQDGKKLSNDIDLLPPEQKRFAGKLLIIGGNKGQFFAVAKALEAAKRFGAGEVRALMPESLKAQVPPTAELYFAPAEASGAFGRSALPEMLRLADWADAVLLVGDSGKNAETTMVFGDFLDRCPKPVFITRDAIDVAMQNAEDWLMRESETGLLLTVPQLQKLLRTIYYPKVVSLSMPTNQLVELLHKFTLSYSVSVATFHNGLIIAAEGGKVVSQEISSTKLSPITLWLGDFYAEAIVARLWNAENDFYKVFISLL